MQTAPSFPRRLLTAAAGLYALAMVVYLVLRLVFGDGFWWLSLLNTFAHLLFLPLVPLLALVTLVRSRIAALRLLPLAVIGGVWFGPYLVSRTQATQTGTTLRVLTFNVWGNNHDLRPIEAWIRQSQADVVLLQEVSPVYAQNELARLLDITHINPARKTPLVGAATSPCRGIRFWSRNISIFRRRMHQSPCACCWMLTAIRLPCITSIWRGR
jgi:hypothetical protein